MSQNNKVNDDKKQDPQSIYNKLKQAGMQADQLPYSSPLWLLSFAYDHNLQDSWLAETAQFLDQAIPDPASAQSSLEEVSAAQVPADLSIHFQTCVLPLLARLSAEPEHVAAASPALHKLALLIGHYSSEMRQIKKSRFQDLLQKVEAEGLKNEADLLLSGIDLADAKLTAAEQALVRETNLQHTQTLLDKYRGAWPQIKSDICAAISEFLHQEQELHQTPDQTGKQSSTNWYLDL